MAYESAKEENKVIIFDMFCCFICHFLFVAMSVVLYFLCYVSWEKRLCLLYTSAYSALEVLRLCAV